MCILIDSFDFLDTFAAAVAAFEKVKNNDKIVENEIIETQWTS